MHMESHEETGNRSELTCDACSAVFDNLQALKYHVDLTHKRWVLRLLQKQGYANIGKLCE